MKMASSDVWTLLKDLCVVLQGLPKEQKTANKNAVVFEHITRLTSHIIETTDHLPSSIDYTLQEQILLRVINELYTFCSVPEFHGREDIGYHKGDFTNTTTRAEKIIPCFNLIIGLIHTTFQNNSNYQSHKGVFLRDILGRTLLICSEHAEHSLWSSAVSIAAANELLSRILLVADCTNLSELLCDPPSRSPLTKGMIGWILQELQPKLQKDIWKRNPGSLSVFKWAMLKVTFPHMGPILPYVLPPCLLMTDDHEAGNKAAGLTSLHHLLKETTREEVRRYGRAEVIYEAVQQTLYTHEEVVLDVALPAIFTVLSVVETMPTKANPPRPESRYDVIMERLLQSMELEVDVVLHRLYAKHLPPLLSAMGLTLCQHLKRLLSVVDTYLQMSDGPHEEARLGALSVLSVLITEAWPRMPHHTDTILKTLLRLVHDVSDKGTTDSSPSQHRLVEEATNCAILLRDVSDGCVHKLLTPVKNNPNINHDCRKFAENVLLDINS